MNELKTYTMELAGRKLTLETGKLAGLANSSVLVKYGETAVLVNVVASKNPREGIDFFPLSVDYEERLYAVGKIPGSFMKREGKPSDKAILISRVIDRPIRPLFPHDLRNDVIVSCLVLSVDHDCSPEICAMIGSSVALSISDVPFGGPTGSVAVGYVNNELVINPTEEQRNNSKLTLTVAGTSDKIAMIEAGADEIPDEIMLQAIEKAHVEIKKICKFISDIKAEIGKPKFEYQSAEIKAELYEEISKEFGKRMYKEVQTADKIERDIIIDKFTEDVNSWYIEKHGEEEYEEQKSNISEAIYLLEKKTVRKLILEERKKS